MTALYVFIGIIAFFVIVLSIPLYIEIEYNNYLNLRIKWLFVKMNILPLEEKEKKEKKPEEKKEEEKPKEEETPKQKGENPIMAMVKAQGYDGMMQIIANLGKALGSFFKRLFKAFTIQNFDISITVGTGDAASTAIKYGETCQKVFPVCGLICSTMKVKTYDVQVEPDFLATHNSGHFSANLYLTPRKLINAVFVLVGELVAKVVLKFILNGKAKTENKQPDNAEATANNGK